MAITESEPKPKALPEGAREAMERLNAEAGKYSIWLGPKPMRPRSGRGSARPASMSAASSRAAASAPIR